MLLSIAAAVGAEPGLAYACLYLTVFYSVASPLMIAWLQQVGHHTSVCHAIRYFVL